jgi:SSS family solute:Na+ symporter
MQAWWMFCLCSAIFVAVSLLTPKPDSRNIEGLTWKSPLQVIAEGQLKGIGDPRVLAGFLLMAMIILYAIFR